MTQTSPPEYPGYGSTQSPLPTPSTSLPGAEYTPPPYSHPSPALVEKDIYGPPRHYIKGGRNSYYRWWKPLLALLGGGLVWFILSNVVAILLLIAFVDNWEEILLLVSGQGGNPLENPVAVLLLLSTVALFIPPLFGAVRLIEWRKPGSLSSITGRLRWGLLVRALIVGIICSLPTIIITLTTGGTLADLGPMVPIIIIAILFVPFQAAAEEYVFRGWAMQTLGGWGAPAWLALILPVILFTAGHVQYGWIGMTDVAVFGLCAAWLTVRTGGLEAAIAFHVLNNLTAFALAILLGGNPVSDAGATVESLIFSAATTLIFTGFTDWWLRREIIKREGKEAMSGPFGSPIGNFGAPPKVDPGQAVVAVTPGASAAPAVQTAHAGQVEQGGVDGAADLPEYGAPPSSMNPQP
ncbi:MAG: type II CAAX endopeptidase family protein [Actinomycetaceae bacterium]|nr:type II CAAX endopeptidase family protein [Actinomycetaceae bacterium]